MAKKTVLECKQGQTYIRNVWLVGKGVTDYTGYSVRFMVKKDFSLENSAAIIDQILTPDPVTGKAQVFCSDEVTADFIPDSYKYQAKLVDPSGRVRLTDVGEFIVKDVLIKGATA